MPKAKRAGKSPRVHKAQIKEGKIIGRGQAMGTGEPVKRVKITERGRGRRVFHAAAKKANAYRGSESRILLAESQRAWRKFHRAGLPVPAFSRVMSRRPNIKKGKYSRHYLTTFMEDMTKKHGKLYDCHVQGKPTFLVRLSAKKDAKLIRSLGRDLAAIYSLGFTCRFLDFWHFYKKKDGKWDRVILDLNSFRDAEGPVPERQNLRDNIRELKDVFGEREFKLFFREFLKHYKGRHRNAAVDASHF